MPELPDVVIYVERLRHFTVGKPIEEIRIASPFVLRSVDPPLSEIEGRVVQDASRLGKRIVLSVEDEYFLVFHLMIAGRFRWKEKGKAVPRRWGLAAFDFPDGTLMLTEAGSRRRASLYAVRGHDGLRDHDRGGLEVLEATPEQFGERLRKENRTLKRALTKPSLFSGIGNAYSDEILHAARLSPTQLTRNLTADEVARLHEAACATLRSWIERLRDEVGEGFPDKVTAFRDGMSVHGRFGKPCPECGSPVQRIRYAANEANYCARCQTGGKLLADRALSRLLKSDWPKTIDEWEDPAETA